MTKQPGPMPAEGLTTAEGWTIEGTSYPAASSSFVHFSRWPLLPSAATAQRYSPTRAG